MVKIPKFSELTDLEKLKAFGNELANKAKDAVGDTEKMSEMARKVKSTVSDKTAEYTGNKKMPITDEAIAKLVVQINESLQLMYDAQKQQVAVMNQLKKQLNALTNIVIAMQSTTTSTETSENPDE